MPLYFSTAGKHACEVYYEVRGETTDAAARANGPSTSGRPDVVLIMGLGATHHCWEPQLEELLRCRTPGGPPATRVLLVDNRGVGRSASPQARRAYSTVAMATDVLSLLDHLSWGRVHVVGHSMGAMVAAKLAVLSPDRVASLALVSATGGGWEAFPKSWACFKIALQIAFARTARQRAWLDLQLHFRKKTLSTVDDRYGRTREELLHEDYLEGAEGGGPGQSADGCKGQLWAVWTHRLSRKEAATIRAADIPVMVIHGRHDILALAKYGERLARRLESACILLEGAHMLCRERGPEVNLLLRHHIFHGRRLRDSQHKYLVGAPDPPLPGPSPGALAAKRSPRSASPASSASPSSEGSCRGGGGGPAGRPAFA